jgi:hypothetical protein
MISDVRCNKYMNDNTYNTYGSLETDKLFNIKLRQRSHSVLCFCPYTFIISFFRSPDVALDLHIYNRRYLGLQFLNLR